MWERDKAIPNPLAALVLVIIVHVTHTASQAESRCYVSKRLLRCFSPSLPPLPPALFSKRQVKKHALIHSEREKTSS